MNQDQTNARDWKARRRYEPEPHSSQTHPTFSEQPAWAKGGFQTEQDTAAAPRDLDADAAPWHLDIEPALEEAEEMPRHDRGPRQPARLSRRKLLIAGGATAGLITAASLGVLELRQLLGKHGPDFLGSLRLAGNRHQLPPAIQQPYTTPQDVVIFSGKLSPKWNDWSWPQPSPVTRTPAFTDGSPVIRFSPANGNAIYFSHAPLDTTGFGFLQFWVHGGAAGGQRLVAGMTDQYYIFTNEPSVNAYTQGGFIQFNEWRLVRIPLADLQSADTKIGGVVIRDASGSLQPDLYIADIRLVHLPNPNRPVLLSGDAPDLATILLFFDRQMLADDVQAAHFYQISSVEDDHYFHPVQPSATRYDQVQKSVGLVVPTTLRDGKRYFVSVGRIRAVDGPMLADASSLSVTAHALELQIDSSKRGQEISPYIYGVNWAPNDGYMTDLRPRVNRWGGEQTSRYNWKLGNAFNAGSDYYFQNGHYQYTSSADRQPSGAADQFIARTLRQGAEALITVPAIGWVAKDDLPSSASHNVPLYGGPPISPGSDICYNGYDPTTNRHRTSVPSRARKGAPFSDPPNRSDPTVAQDEWMYHLVNRFGTASNHGVRFYGIDNEPELWNVLQRDIRPAQINYDQSLQIFLDYATAIKDVDPSAMITGPVVWGWPNYFYSALDRNTDNFKTLPDYHAHGDIPFLIWWMQQIKKHDDATGRRNLDLLDMHFSPAGLNPYDANPAKNDPNFWPTRLRSTRLLWDRTYKDEFWVNNYVYLIPRMLEWIAQSYPGTKLAISEYSWGGLNVMNGALAQAEVLGIFGREGVYLACTWPPPDPYSPVYYAFKLYSNFDGQGGWFNGTSIHAQSTQPEIISCFAAEQKNGDVFLTVLNKNIRESLTPTIHLPGLAPRNVTVYRYGPDPRQPLAQVDSFTLQDQVLRPALPPYSISLFYLAKST
jgi:hypothetical protein